MFTKFSFQQKSNDGRLLLINMVYTSYLTSCHGMFAAWGALVHTQEKTKTWDLMKLANIKKVSKPHRMIA